MKLYRQWLQTDQELKAAAWEWEEMSEDERFAFLIKAQDFLFKDWRARGRGLTHAEIIDMIDDMGKAMASISSCPLLGGND